MIINDIDNIIITYKELFNYYIKILYNYNYIYKMRIFDISININVDNEIFQNYFLLIYKKIISLKLFEYFIDIFDQSVDYSNDNSYRY